MAGGEGTWQLSIRVNFIAILLGIINEIYSICYNYMWSQANILEEIKAVEEKCMFYIYAYDLYQI